MADRIQLRGDTAANWSAVNPVLAQRELAIEFDSGVVRFKVGDGVTAWNSLPYALTPTLASITAGVIPKGDATFGLAASKLSETAAGALKVDTGIIEKYADLGTGSNIDLALGNYFYKTIGATTTFTVSNMPTSGLVGSFSLELLNAGQYTINWWSGIKWSGGVAPSLSLAGTDIVSFYTSNGGVTWRGVLVAKDSK